MATTTEWKILKANPETQRAQLNSVLQDIWNRLSEADRTATAAANTGATLSTIVDDPDSGLRANSNAIRFTTAKVFTLEGTTTAIAEDVTALDARVDDLDTTTSGNSSAINALTARVDVNEGDIAATATDVTALETAVYDPSTGLAATSDAVNTLESRVTVNEGDITVISSDITTLQGRITTAETDINNVESVNTAQGTAISGLDTRLTSAEGTITSHATSLTSLDSRVDTVEIDITDIETVNSGQATAISGLDTRVTAAEGNITSTSSSLTALTSRVDTAESDINAVETVNSGQATAISGLDTRVTSAEGTITAHSSSITQLETDVDGNTAAITAEQTARTTADNALANDREMLAVQLRGSYTGSDLASVTTGLIAQEKTARVSEDEALAQQLTLLSVGVGEQFDYAEIWYFATGVDGWTGPIAQPTATNSWLRPANGSADTRVYSPDGLNVSGTEYPQLRLRIRKTGAPVWDGSFAWKDGTGVWSATNTLTEPAWDSDDIGVITETVAWSAEVDQLWFELAVNQTATDYYEIDWVAIGRPAPGASSAALSEELAVRAAADAAEVTARELLSTKIIGTTDPDGLTIETLTSGLLYDERSARVTADSAEVTARTALEARVDDTEADITSIQTAYTAADAALASDITSLDTRLTDAEGDIVATSSGLSSLDTRVTTAEGTITAHGSDITSLDSRLDTAESDIATKASSSALSALDTRVTSAEGTITSHSSDITTLENDVYHVSTGLATKASTSALNSLDSRVDVTESDIVAITSDVTALETTVNHPSTGVAANASAISSLDTRVSSAEGTITSHSSDITTLENSVFDASTGLATKASTSALNALDSRVDVTESTISTHASDITALQTTVDDPTTGVAANASAVTALDSRLDAAEGTISAHGSDITALEGVIEHPTTGLATKAAITTVDQVQSNVDSVAGTVASQGTSITQIEASLSKSRVEIVRNGRAAGLGDPHWWGNTTIATDTTNPVGILYPFATTGTAYEEFPAMLPCAPGDVFDGTITSWTGAYTGGPVEWGLHFVDKDGGFVGFPGFGYLTQGGGWIVHTGQITAPANAAFVRAFVWVDAGFGPVYFGNYSVIKVTKSAVATATRMTAAEARLNDTGAGKTIEVVASDLASITAAVNDASTGLATKAAITTVNQVQSNLDTVAGTVASHTSSIDTHTSQIANKAEASVVTAIETRVATQEQTGKSVNKLVNSSFAINANGWTTVDHNGVGIHSSSGWSNGNIGGSEKYTPPYVNGFLLHSLSTTTGGLADIYSTVPVPVQEGKRYLLSAFYNAYRTNVRPYIGWFNADGNLFAYTDTGIQYGATSVVDPSLADLPRMSLVDVAPAGAVAARAAFRMTTTGEILPYLWLIRPMFEEVPTTQTQPSPWNAGGEESFASWSVTMDVNGYATGFGLASDGTSSNFWINAANLKIINPAGGNSLSWYGAEGVLSIYNATTDKAIMFGPSLGSDADKMTAYFGPNGAAADRTLANAVWGITASGKTKFGNTGANPGGGWSTTPTITYSVPTLGTPATVTVNAAAGVFVSNGVSISYNAGQVQFSQARNTTVLYYLYYDDPGMTGGTKSLLYTTSKVTRNTNPGYVLVGEVSVTTPPAGTAGGGGGDPYER